MKTSTLFWLLAAAIVIAAMVGYYFWRVKKSESPPDKHGVITGIFYTEENPSAVVGLEIVHEGDTIYGVKVVKIHPDKVEFEKNGKSWSQKIREKPSPSWPKAD